MNVKVIKKIEGRIDRNNGTILKERLRVTAYCRVSTDTEDQLNSYRSQKQYYKEKISSNSEWVFVDIYADEAISGTLANKRNDFMRMIQDAMLGKFDMIITKSISRFARNTVDTLKYVRILKEHNIAVIFEEEGINTLEMSGELLLTILSSVAQQESENISTHVKLGLRMKKERGELVGFNNCLGYRYDYENKRMNIVEEEAEIVRMIFNRYLEGYGADRIAKELTKMKIKTPKSKNNIWYESTIRKILKNEKYKGDVLQGKTFTIDPISHKRLVNMGEEDKFYIENHHEPIIEPEIFDEVQQIMKQRCGARQTGRRKGNISRKYALSSRMICGFCGSVLSRRSLYVNQKKTMPSWLCQTSFKQGKEFCKESKIIKEEIVENAFIEIYRLITKNKKIEINSFLKLMKEAERDNTPTNKIKKLKQQFAEIKSKEENLLEFLLNGIIDKETYNSKKEQLTDKKEKIETEIESLELLVEDNNSIENGLDKIIEIINQDIVLDEFDKEIFDALIDYVIIGGYDENNKKNPYMLRFICKTNISITKIKELDKEKITNSNINQNILESSNIVLLDFISKQKFFCFERNEDGKLRKNVISNIRVRVELDLQNE